MSKTNKQRVDKNRWPGVYYYEEIKKGKKKPDVCYYISFKIDGRKKWEKIGWKSEGYTPQVAAEVRAERVKQARHGDDVKTQKEIRQEQAKKDRPINEIADEYFKIKGPEMKGKGARIDRYRYDKYVNPILGTKPVSQLSQLDTVKITRNMEDKSTSSKWAALEILRRVINFGVKYGMCKPINFKIELPKKNNKVTEYLEAEQVQSLFQTLESWPSQDVARMVKLAFFTGIRRGEIFALQESDVDFVQGLIMLKGPEREGPKGGESTAVPMNETVKKLLEEQIQWKNDNYPESPYLFPGRGGRMRTHCSAVKRIKDKAGLPEDFRIFHGLRHHFGVTLANSGEFGLDMIGELLTHKSPSMTKRYAQFLPDTVKKASERATELLQDNSNKEDQRNEQKVVNLNKGKKK